MPMPLMVLLLFFGLSLGSFLNVVGRRIPLNQPFFISRSACPQCHHLLTWYELIPVLSYLFQKGKCRNCHQKISPLYPIVEILAGLMILWCSFKIGITSHLIIAFVYISFFLSLFVAVMTSKIIPQNLLTFFLILLAFLKLAYSYEGWYLTLFIVGLSFLYVLFINHLKTSLFVIIGQVLIINYLVLNLTNLLIAFFLTSLLTLLIFFTRWENQEDSRPFQNIFIVIFISVTMAVYLFNIA